MTNFKNIKYSTISAACIALNVSLNKLAASLALPVFADSIGTILSVALVPLPFSILVGIVSNLLGGVITHPAIPFYIGTQLVIALMAFYAYKKAWFYNIYSTILVGLSIGVISAILSAPITVVIFGGVTEPGATALNAILLAAGNDIWTSVISGTLIISSIDKVAACIFVYLLLKRIPKRLQQSAYL